ncbi:hypothetical protein GEMRC1_009356 [Eukaryota sp. GEM-RC1]
MKEHQSEADWTLTILFQSQERSDLDVFLQLQSSSSEDVKPSITAIIQSVKEIEKAEPLCLKPETFDLIIDSGKKEKMLLYEDLTEWKEEAVETIMFGFDVELLHPRVWSESLLAPLQKFKNLESVLMRFSFYKLNPLLLSLVSPELQGLSSNGVDVSIQTEEVVAEVCFNKSSSFNIIRT